MAAVVAILAVIGGYFPLGGTLGWDIETVDSTEIVGECTSIALDSSSYPHISYFDWTNRDLKYARWTGSTWSIETVDSAGWVGWCTSIALDSSGYPHISYYDGTNKDLKYAKLKQTTAISPLLVTSITVGIIVIIGMALLVRRRRRKGVAPTEPPRLGSSPPQPTPEILWMHHLYR